MGAETFITKSRGVNPRDAFAQAREAAQYDYGHAGYTGSIAEKHDYVMIPFTPTEDGPTAEQFAYKLIDDADPRIDDKWGPAGCILLGEGEYLFFGWASS